MLSGPEDDAGEPSNRPSKRARVVSPPDDEMDIDFIEVACSADPSTVETTVEATPPPAPPCSMTAITGKACTPCPGHHPSCDLLKARHATFEVALSTHPHSAHTALVRARADAGLAAIAQYAAWFDRHLYKRTVVTEQLVRNTAIPLGNFYATVGRARTAYAEALDDKMRHYLDVLAGALDTSVAMELALGPFECALAGLMMAFERAARDAHSRCLRTLDSSVRTIKAALTKAKRGRQ